MPPDPNEIGWKDTVRVNPGEIATVIMQFNLPNLPTAAMRKAVVRGLAERSMCGTATFLSMKSMT